MPARRRAVRGRTVLIVTRAHPRSLIILKQQINNELLLSEMLARVVRFESANSPNTNKYWQRSTRIVHARQILAKQQPHLNNDYFMTRILHRRANLPTSLGAVSRRFIREPVIKNVKNFVLFLVFQRLPNRRHVVILLSKAFFLIFFSSFQIESSQSFSFKSSN